VPVDDREQPLLFHARTADFQDVTVQATLTYRVADPALAAARLDFSLDPERGTWRAAPLAQLAGLLTETAQQHALDLLARTALTDALATGVPAVRSAVEAGLAGDVRLAETGIAVIGVRVVAIRPEPDVERALQTPTREQVQQEADRATYERRALAVEREGAISENELANQLELARRTEELIGQRGANGRREAEEAAAAAEIAAESQARRDRQGAQVRAEADRLLGTAAADARAAELAAYADARPEVLVARALEELARNLPHIDSVVLTPDLLAPVLAKLGGAR
jgi:regulator of protease activity HflC (stomatin/prohibitin superfamily)